MLKKDRLKDVWSYLIGKANRIGGRIFTTVGGVTHKGGTPDSTVKQAYGADNWVYAAITLTARSLASVPLESRDPSGDMIEAGPSVDIIKRPNPATPGILLRQDIAIDLMLTGDAYVGIEKDGGKVELYTLPSEFMSVKWNKATGHANGYLFKEGTFERHYEMEEVIHFRLPNPYSTLYGFSPVTPIVGSIDLYYYVKRLHKRIFKNGGMPGGVIETEDSPSPEECERIAKRFDDLYGGDNQNATAVIGGGGKYKGVTPAIKDMMFPQLRAAAREDNLSPFFTPPFLLGMLDKMNFANSRSALKIFWENGIQPVGTIITEFLNMRLPDALGLPGVEFYHNYDRVEALQEERGEKTDRLRKGTGRPFITVNEAREEMNLDALEGGDDLPAAFAPEEIAPGTDPDENDEENPDEKTRRPVRRFTRGAAGASSGDLYLSRFEKRLTGTEQDFEKVMKKYWHEQLARILKSIDEIAGDSKSRSALQPYRTRGTLSPDNMPAIIDLQKEADELIKTARPFFEKVIADQYDFVSDELSMDVLFSVTNPEVAGLLKDGVNKLVNVNEKTYKVIKEILLAGYDAGDSIDAIKRSITERYNHFGKKRARVVARTELTKFVNGGTLAAYEDSGVVKSKDWISAGDARDTHQDASAAPPIPINERFAVGDSLLKYPGDPAGSPEEIINCRCTFRAIL
jgi:HK97 family phage portal protein